MKRRDLIKTLAMAAIGTSALMVGSQGANAEEKSAHPANPEPFLRVGQTARYDSGLKITFVSVKSDSRCPMGALCITAGDAEILLRVKVGRQNSKIISIHTNLSPRVVVLSALPPGMVGIPKSYTLRISELTPRPRIGKKIKQSDYRLGLSIETAV